MKSRGTALAYAAGVALFALYTAFLALTEHHRILRDDDWRIFDDLFRNGALRWLFDSQVGHRFPATLGLLYLDHVLLGGHMALPVAVSVLCCAAATAALWPGVAVSRDGAGPAVLAAFAFGAFLLFWSQSALVFRWGVMEGNAQAPIFLFGGASALALYASGRDTAGRGRPALLALALLCAAASTFSHGAGFAAFGALLAMAVVARLPLRATLAIAAVAAPTVLLYTAGLSDDPGVALPRSLSKIERSPLDLPTFAIAFVGNAVGWVASGLDLVRPPQRITVSVASGALGLAAAAAICVWLLRHPERARGRRLVGFGLMASTAGLGLVIAALRLAFFGVEQAIDLRFLCWSGLFWIGLALAAPPELPDGSRAWRATALVGLFALLSLLALPSLRLFDERAALDRRIAEEVALQLLLGIRHDPSAVRLSIYNAEVVYRSAAHLRASGRNLFADPRGLLPGEELVRRFAPVAPSRCQGGVAEAHPLVGSRPSAVHWAGWARTRPPGEAPRYVVITDDAGVIRGLGSFDDRHAGGTWFAVLARPRLRRAYQAWAVLADGRSACPIGAAIRPLPSRARRSPG